MSRAIIKFIAVFMTIWLPLFSGNVLAVSIDMQSMGNGCHAAIQQDEHRMHHAQSVVNQDQSAGADDRQDFSCETGSICHLACCLYFATAAANVVEGRLAAQLFTLPSTQFQSYVSAPLDPPPLPRV